MDPQTLIAFALTFSLIAFSPGLCMTLAMTLGISIGVKRTLWMMIGELSGISVVGASAIFGNAALMLQYPQVFDVALYAAAVYLVWTALRTWRASADVKVSGRGVGMSNRQLIAAGFITATSNPKAWIFDASLLPTFINPDQASCPRRLSCCRLLS